MKSIPWKEIIFENSSYKMVALFIAMILWLTILGRRDFVLQKSIEVEVIADSTVSVREISAEAVKVKVSGPRTALRRFVDSGASQLISVDLTGKTEGEYDVEVPAKKIDVPFGVKVISVKPNRLHVKLDRRVGRDHHNGGHSDSDGADAVDGEQK